MFENKKITIEKIKELVYSLKNGFDSELDYNGRKLTDDDFELLNYYLNCMSYYLNRFIDKLESSTNDELEDFEDKREMYIKEISEYQDILELQIKRENEIVGSFGGLSEKEQVYEDINSYLHNDFDCWNSLNDFENYILYLEKITGITNKLGLEEENIND